MRRLSDDARREQTNLLLLSVPQRLFVQQWIELFDRDVPLSLRSRSLNSVSLHHELSDLLATFNGSGKPPFHVAWVREEMDARSTELRSHTTSEWLAAIEIDPARAARDLAEQVLGLGYSPEFAFQAYRSMIYPPNDSFEIRLERLLSWWHHHQQPRPFEVSFLVTRSGITPAGWTVTTFDQLPALLREAALRITRDGPQSWLQGRFVTTRVHAVDVNGAAGAAREAVRQGLNLAAHVKDGRAARVDTRWHFLFDPDQSPEPKAYVLDLVDYRYPLPRQLEGRAEMTAFSAAASADPVLMAVLPPYFEAIDAVKDGRMSDAARAIFTVHERCFDDCASTGKKIGDARRFAEDAALLSALAELPSEFDHLYRYCVAKSYQFGGDTLLQGERRRERVYDEILDPERFAAVAARTPWDVALRHRRDTLMRQVDDLGVEIHRRRTRIRWDLARAIRARNLLFHRGQTLRDEHYLAVVLAAVGQVLDLRLAASRRGVTFADVLTIGRSDLESWSLGRDLPSTRDYLSQGWRGQRSQFGMTLSSDVLSGSP